MTSTSTASAFLAEDDPDDRLLIEEALLEAEIRDRYALFRDGDEILAAIRDRVARGAPLPRLVVVDFNMPRIGGLDVLMELRAVPETAAIPLVVFTTSAAPRDVRAVYAAGGHGFVTKPAGFDDLARTLRLITTYWLDVSTPAG